MTTPELPNPFTDARIVGHDVDPAIYHSVNDAYKRGDPRMVVTFSMLRDFYANPRKWLAGWTPKSTLRDECGRFESKSLEWGYVVDTLALSPDQYSKRIAAAPETYENDEGKSCPWDFRSKARKQWAKDQSPKVVITADLEAAAIIAEAKLYYASTPDLPFIGTVKHSDFLDSSEKQVHVTAKYRDKETGIEIDVQGLLDIVPHADHPQFGKVLADLKTGRDASHEKFSRQVYDCKYHGQGAMFSDLHEAATHEGRADWWWLVQESEEPYESVIWPCPAEILDLGRLYYLTALKLYCQCLKTGNWPTYGYTGPMRGIVFTQYQLEHS